MRNLNVNGVDLVDDNGNKIMLKGISNHGLSWYPQYVNVDTMRFFKKDFGINAYRLAMYTAEENGYCVCSNEWRHFLLDLVDKGVKAAIELDMYVIIDWHILSDSNPLVYLDLAKDFFEIVSTKYSDVPNVLFEICNEPNVNCKWDDVKEYANNIIPIIRKHCNNIIICGTTTWSQDVDLVINSKLNYSNIMYALHFYSSTHKDGLRDKCEKAINNGVPVFISEFGVCEANGNGFIDYEEKDKWFDFINKYNLSNFCWNLSNRDEASAILKPNVDKLTDFNDSDYREAGLVYKKHFLTE